MDKMRNMLLAGVVLAGIAGPAAAAETTRYRQFEKWDVRVDQNLGYGCFMLAHWDQTKTWLRFGFNLNEDAAYIMVGNASWTAMKEGADYQVSLSFDGRAPVQWIGHAWRMTGGDPALYLPTRDKAFVQTISAASGLDITYQGRSLLNGRLPGSAEAATSMVDCQQQFGFERKPTDPFVGAGVNADPFKRL